MASIFCLGLGHQANAATSKSQEQSIQAEIVVYGGASGGVSAAVQAARMGRQVVLVSEYDHLGGMTSSGLGWSDIGNESILGGVCREFYHQVYLHYQQDEAWNIQPRARFANRGQGVPALNDRTELASVFEPKVAEAVFDKLVADAGVRLVFGRLDLRRGVDKRGARITALHLEDGRTVRGRVYIDASYEGDLLEAAGVSFATGREPNSAYGETSNGITGLEYGNQLVEGVDPYLAPGDPTSGLLPGVNPSRGGPIGSGDHRIQAYCYRMVLTDAPGNRAPIAKPAGYDAADYELLFRCIEAGQTSRFFKNDWMPNRKTDSNNASGISTDYIGANYGDDWNWATLNYAQREELASRHRDWQLGMLWTLQHHPRVPSSVRERCSKWGLAKDEFVDNQNWPYVIYIREARRMVSDFVMTERHCCGLEPVAHSIGMGAYTLDSHNVQRYVHDGMVKNEGDIQKRIQRPYSIPYQAIIPREPECDNLLVPWALSASHIAFGSIRMEPVFMVLGQSAATAAAIAVSDNIAVQQVPYQRLRERLERDGQFLSLPVNVAADNSDATGAKPPRGAVRKATERL
ncbi:hypothetical protein Pla123a_07540 [Posidoniimonas polymericola]|uniref:FAD dependent oxidoreductase n=1 Tax=Posidoniimonas polymericola TaxID=2528002 RepID=A0A5C5ZFY3_9BACT|nr:FAD-dependent oxidoreductase [Posidoniimonas polymericola]TWT85947.1 hypothetical protein Pla123a_07540 [Posidoniimonas polymericola]